MRLKIIALASHQNLFAILWINVKIGIHWRKHHIKQKQIEEIFVGQIVKQINMARVGDMLGNRTSMHLTSSAFCPIKMHAFHFWTVLCCNFMN
jgi:hypothetical protein